MSARKKLKTIYFVITLCLPCLSSAAIMTPSGLNAHLYSSLAKDSIEKELGWVETVENHCGGYYLEEPFTYLVNPEKASTVEIMSNQTLFSQRETSVLQGSVKVTRYGQQMTANRAFLYRDPVTFKLKSLDLLGNVHLREPNTLVIGKRGHYEFNTKAKTFVDIVYRTAIYTGKTKKQKVTAEEMQKERKITALTAWGQAAKFSQILPKVYELYEATFTTCPPIDPTWQIKASHIVLDKNKGRGYATHMRLYVKKVPIVYVPYFSFSIDNQRKSGFLWPTVGTNSRFGPYTLLPFYWNMAPNYDMILTPGYLSKRGFQFTDYFRYLSHKGSGKMNFNILPRDRDFARFQTDANEHPNQYFKSEQDPTITQAELNRLQNASTTRAGFYWRDDTKFNPNWSSHVDFNYASDDYYLRDFGSNLNEITQNQLLQEADIYYKSSNWNFTGRLQTYQTLHPVNEAPVLNQYRRLPQLILNGDFPDQPLGLEYFINNDITHFEILKTPGTDLELPVGNRIHTQPGVMLPLYWPYFYINPRLQFAFTQYQLYQTEATNTPGSKRRFLPIFDIASGLSFERYASLFGYAFKQTLEPQLYYTYIPYRNQASIPIFDTTVNTLTYDQIFNYNRFTGLDRIGDANQLAWGVTTRFIDQETGVEKVRFGIGDIIYFADRRVTLCNDQSVCNDYPGNPNNHYSLSPVSSVLNFNIIAHWGFEANAIWNPITKHLDNTTLALNYETDNNHIFNLAYNYARGGDILAGIETPNDSLNNLKVTTVSFVWPLLYDFSAVGLWSQNWNRRHLQNLIYGLQYDTCCWAFRIVGGKAFVGVDPIENNKFKYNNEFYIQFDLKGLGDIQSSNPNSILSSITGYNPQFGQETQ